MGKGEREKGREIFDKGVIVRLLALVLIIFSQLANAETYIDVSYNDELFIIDGERYEAKTYCFNVEEGDPVVFLKGRPGVCVSATLLNLRTNNICEVWCH